MFLRQVILCRSMLAAGILAVAAGLVEVANSKTQVESLPHTFGFEAVERIAAQLAEKAYVEPEKIPEFLQRINYDQWRDIRFKTDRSLWRGENLFFETQFFHPGFLYQMPVKINIVQGQEVEEFPFSPELFNYGMNDFGPKVPQNLGFAGFRFHCPLNKKDYYDEVIVFLGASYFRAVAKGQKYGISARGLALEVAEQKGEEFPFFKEFWLIKPKPGQNTVSIYALLDSPSLSGAYHFHVEPGDQTLINVRSTLFPRRAVKKIGLAPMTSMFLHGENQNIRSDDFRPEVHDSDGLLIGSDRGEWIWRPLRNPKALFLSTYPVEELKGFGLLQRDIEFESYQDLEALYQQRPSIWISPQGDWGPGHVELIELPTNTEIHDNIIAYWVPRQSPEQGRPISLAYRMNWYIPKKDRHEKGWVMATRTSVTGEPPKRRFLVDFKGGQLERLNNALALEPVVTVTKGARIVDLQLQNNAFTGSWRLVFSVVPAERELLDKVITSPNSSLKLRAFLRQEGNPVTETWSYSYEP
ncbi:MAG: glucan biosynthesis protein G [Desulfobacteraceae bacterium]|nr:MAG: glucan biosynthesis protein G [Desulfobacteraceae bacterium]